MNKNTSIFIWVLAICVVLAAAYTFYTKNKPDYLLQSKQNATTNQASKQVVPDFSLQDLDGKTVKLSDYRGKIVILNFWAVWCKYCKEEMPDFNELNKILENDNEAVILAVNVQESSDTAKKYLTQNNINLKVLMDKDGSVAKTYEISGLPNTFIINRDGTLYGYIPGATNKETLQQYIDKAKKGEPVK